MLSSPRTHDVQIVIEQVQKGVHIEVMKATVACGRDVVSFEARLARMVKKAISEGEAERQKRNAAKSATKSGQDDTDATEF